MGLPQDVFFPGRGHSPLLCAPRPLRHPLWTQPCAQLACRCEPLCPLSTLCFLTWHLRAPRAGLAERAGLHPRPGTRHACPGLCGQGQCPVQLPSGRLLVGVAQPAPVLCDVLSGRACHSWAQALAPRPRQSKFTADPTRPHLQPGPSGLPPHAPGGSGSRQSVEGWPAPERPAAGPPGGGLQGLLSRGTGVHLGRPRGLCPPGCVSG